VILILLGFTPGFGIVERIEYVGDRSKAIDALNSYVEKHGGRLAPSENPAHRWYRLDAPTPCTIGFLPEKNEEILVEVSAVVVGGCSEIREARSVAKKMLTDVVEGASRESGISMHLKTP